MPTQQKAETIADLTDKLSRSQFTVVGDYRGLTVAEITDLRTKLRATGAELIVAKNTLVLRAAREQGQEAIEELLAGPTAVMLTYEDIAKTAKALSDFNKGPKKLVVRGGMLGKSLLREDAVDQATKLPSRQEVLAQIVGGVSSPVAGVVGVINAAITNVLYVLQARIDQVQPSDEAAAS